MASVKQASKKTAAPRATTAFMTVHEKKIVTGSSLVIEGWLGAGIEAISKKMSASAYAEASHSDSLGGVSRYGDETIRTEVGIAIRAIKKYKTINGVMNALVDEKGGNYRTQSWKSVKFLMAGTGQHNNTGKTAKKKSVKKVETTEVRKKMKKAGVPQRYIDIVMYALDNE